MPLSQPQSGLLLRGSLDTGYELIDMTTNVAVARGLVTLAEAVVAARRHGATVIWQERPHRRGGPTGSLFRLPLRVPLDE